VFGLGRHLSRLDRTTGFTDRYTDLGVDALPVEALAN